MRISRTLFALLLCLVFAVPAHAAEKPPRFAIVLASFGSTDAKAQATQEAFVKAAQARYPDIPVYVGLTARLVQKKLKEQGKPATSIFRALADVADEGFTHVAVQSLQVIPGEEFEGVQQVAKAQEGLPKGLKRVSVGGPLIASNEDAASLASALLAALPKERKAEDTVIFVGHGSPHGVGGMIYPSLQWHVHQKDKNAFVGTVEGTPSLEETMAALPLVVKGKPAPKVWLVPLLAMAGEHARNDLFGDEPDSWKNIITKSGRECKALRIGLLDIPAVRNIWFAHLDEALAAVGAAPAKAKQ